MESLCLKSKRKEMPHKNYLFRTSQIAARGSVNMDYRIRKTTENSLKINP